MDWRERLRREALSQRGETFDLVYHAAIVPAVPPEYEVPGLVGLTFRLNPREPGRALYATLLDLPAAVHMGARLGLGPAEAVAMVDSHERVHVHLQLAYERLHETDPALEEEHARIVDAVWLSLRHPRAAERLLRGEVVVTRVEPGFWEELVEVP